MESRYLSKRDAIRALIEVCGDDRGRWGDIVKGFWLLTELRLLNRGGMQDAGATARTMLNHRASGRHGWPETADSPPTTGPGNGR